MNEDQCIEVKIIEEHGRKFIVFVFESGHEYDPDMETSKNKWWISHMRDKTWFTKQVEEKLMNALMEYITKPDPVYFADQNYEHKTN